MNSSKKILIAPLDWGLGHTTRCIPLIQTLLDKGHIIYTCGNKDSEIIFNQHFPQIKHHIIKGYNVKYGNNKSQSLSMILQSPKFFKTIRSERKTADYLTNKLNLDYIISDNRFGFRSTKTKNIFISHQIHIQGPKFLKPVFYKINTHYIKQFDQCWIPDLNEKENLSGILSKSPIPKNCSFIGPLSRFKHAAKSSKTQFKYLAIISGPEPQRSLFEKIVIKEFLAQDSPCAIIGGKPSGNCFIKENITYFNHLETQKFYNVINSSQHIICRAGYSTIMDLSVLQKDVLMIPTPGQTEQEYLAEHHSKISGTKWMEQKKFKLNGLHNYNKIMMSSKSSLLEKELLKIGL